MRCRARGSGSATRCVLQSQAALHFRLRSDDIREPLDLDEIELAVVKGTTAEFTGVRSSQPGKLGEGVEHGPDGGATAMNM